MMSSYSKMTSVTNDKSYLEEIAGESKEDRRRRLNRLSQQRGRARNKLLPKKTDALSRYLPTEDVQEFTDLLDKLKTFVTKEAKVEDLPELKKAIARLPEKVKQISKVKDCDDLEDKIFDRQEELEEETGKPAGKRATVTQNMKAVNVFYRKYIGNTTRGAKVLDCTDFRWTRETDKVIKFNLQENKGVNNSIAQPFSALAAILRNLEGYEVEQEIYSKLAKKYKADAKEDSDENKLSPEQQKNYLIWDVITDRINKKKDEMSEKERAVIAVYTTRSPRRLGDYALMKIRRLPAKFVNIKEEYEDLIETLDKIFNWLIVNDGVPYEFVYNIYKTSGKYKQQRYTIYDMKKELKTELVEALSEYINDKDNKIQTGKFLFTQNKGQPCNKTFSTYLADTFAKYVKKRTSVNLLRHAYIANFLDLRPTNAQKLKLAKEMAHSIKLQSEYDVVDDRYAEKLDTLGFGNDVEEIIAKQLTPEKAKKKPKREIKEEDEDFKPSPKKTSTKKKKHKKEVKIEETKESPKKGDRAERLRKRNKNN